MAPSSARALVGTNDTRFMPGGDLRDPLGQREARQCVKTLVHMGQTLRMLLTASQISPLQ